MRSKKGRISAVFLALVLLFSFTLVMFAGCGDPEGEGGGEGSNAAKFVTDDSLSDKLLAMYTFEESNPANGTALNAYDPYTGNAIPSANGKYETNQNTSSLQTVALSGLTQDDYTLTTNSTQAFNVTGTLSFDSALSELYAKDGNGDPQFSNGVSVSFWAYNYKKDTTVSSETAGTLAIDYANVVSNGDLAVTWGNLNDGGSVMYPDQDTTVGRAAYTDKYITGSETEGSYYDAQAEFTTEQLSKFDMGWARSGGYDTYDFTGWNVISGNVQDADKDSTVDQISEYCYLTWRYITVSMDENGVSFYMNGRLAYYYSAETYLAGTGESGWNTDPEPSNTTSNLYRYIWGLIGGEVEHPRLPGRMQDINTDLGLIFDMFGADAKAYVDDLIIGYALSATEAQALYQNLSGVTYAAEDITIGTSLSEEEIAKENAVAAKMDELLEQYKSKIGENNVATNHADEGKYTKSQRDAFIAEDGETAVKNAQGYYEELGSTALNGNVAAGAGIYKPTPDEDGYFEMKITALQLSKGADNTLAANARQNWWGIYAMLGQNVSTTPQSVASIQGSAGMDFFLLNSTWGASGTGATNSVEGVWMSGLNTTTGTGHTLTFESDDKSDVLFVDVQSYSWIVITLKWNGSSLRLTLDYYYYYAGDVLEGLTPAVGSAFDYEPFVSGFRAEAWYGSVTLNVQPAEGETRSIDEIVDMSDLGLRFGTEQSYLLITDVEGGTSTVSFHEPTASANSIS